MTDENKDANSEQMAHTMANKNEEPAKNVANWLQNVHHGTLSTLSTKKGIEEYPIGSIVPYALTSDGKPFILVADIAAHTRNMNANPKSALFISDPNGSGDPQAHWRACLIGDMKRVVVDSDMKQLSNGDNTHFSIVSEDEEERLLARYLERVPPAETYLKTHNFSFYVMDEIKYVRYIAGFGRICWIHGADLTNEMRGADLLDVKTGAIEHMNEDHEDSMIDICRGFHDIQASKVEMVELDAGGIMMKTQEPDRYVYCSYPNRIVADDMRTVMVQMTKAARKKFN